MTDTTWSLTRLPPRGYWLWVEPLVSLAIAMVVPRGFVLGVFVQLILHAEDNDRDQQCYYGIALFYCMARSQCVTNVRKSHFRYDPEWCCSSPILNRINSAFQSCHSRNVKIMITLGTAVGISADISPLLSERNTTILDHSAPYRHRHISFVVKT